MIRFWFLLVALAVALFVLRRLLGAGGRPPPRARGRDAGPSTLLCAECGSRYDPNITGWVCPRCGK